jgi:hypothetical protein
LRIAWLNRAMDFRSAPRSMTAAVVTEVSSALAALGWGCEPTCRTFQRAVSSVPILHDPVANRLCSTPRLRPAWYGFKITANDFWIT